MVFRWVRGKTGTRISASFGVFRDRIEGDQNASEWWGTKDDSLRICLRGDPLVRQPVIVGSTGDRGALRRGAAYPGIKKQKDEKRKKGLMFDNRIKMLIKREIGSRVFGTAKGRTGRQRAIQRRGRKGTLHCLGALGNTKNDIKKRRTVRRLAYRETKEIQSNSSSIKGATTKTSSRSTAMNVVQAAYTEPARAESEGGKGTE